MHFGLATSEEIAIEFGRRIRAHRLAQDFQQSELAARAGVSERALRNFERSGKASLELLVRVAAALGLIESMSTLFELRPKSIREMELYSIKRQRASRKAPEKKADRSG